MLDGAIDVVGDVHGEIDALRALLAALGYDAHGEHRAGRRLVFLGDLGDRGPDSPAVVELVRGLVERGLAQCILGNHELNLLRGAPKHGNRWYVDPSHREQQEEFKHCKPVPDGVKADWHEFFLGLPLALERDDLRVVHAAWDAAAVATLRAEPRTSLEVFEDYDRQTRLELERSGILERARREGDANADAIRNEHVPMGLLADVGKMEELNQMGNPVRILTSGAERVTQRPFWANGEWRMCDRVRWWDEYEDATPVLMGHYWRHAVAGKPDLFQPRKHDEWVGKGRNVFCVDFSVGARYRERQKNVTPFATRLGAVRWPERELVLDDGTRHVLDDSRA